MKSGVVFLQKVSSQKVEFSRKLRSEMTDAEACLWKMLRNRKLGGCKFRRQQIIQGFIVDFFCEKAKLVIEVDGGIHDIGEQKKADELRRRVFESRGLVEIRFNNDEIVGNLDGVLRKIEETIMVRTGSPDPRT